MKKFNWIFENELQKDTVQVIMFDVILDFLQKLLYDVL